MKQHRCAPPEFTCQQCGLTFENAASRRRQTYCSYACHQASRRLIPAVRLERARARAREHHAVHRQSYSAHMVAWRKELRRRDAKKKRIERGAALEHQKAETKARYAASADRRREMGRAWRAANPGRMLELKKSWKKANPDKVRAERRGRDRKSNARRRAWLMKLQRGRCAYCREKLGADCHIDHIIPVSKGGQNRRTNLQLACAPCNLSKHARHPIEFARSLGRLL